MAPCVLPRIGHVLSIEVQPHNEQLFLVHRLYAEGRVGHTHNSGVSSVSRAATSPTAYAWGTASSTWPGLATLWQPHAIGLNVVSLFVQVGVIGMSVDQPEWPPIESVQL